MSPNALIAKFNRLPLWRRRLRVWNFLVHAPTFDRWLYLWMHRLGRMGREEADFLQQIIRPGMHIADVGANLGLYSLLLARCAGPTGRVYAFEPDSRMAATLRQNLTTNGITYAEVFACAVGASNGTATLERNALNSGDNRLLSAMGGDALGDQSCVPVCTLQKALHGRRLDFIKMDVQGWEDAALRGVAELLDGNPNLQIYFEFWPHGLRLAGTEVTRLAETLRQLRLKVTLAGPVGDTPVVDLVALADNMAPKAFMNLLARR